jgi:hypothetical protein
VSLELTERSARALLEEVCAALGLGADDAKLMRLGSNAVFHLQAPVVVRISRQGADLDEARRTLAVARWLESVDYPAVRAVDVDQPIVLDGHVITFWKSVSTDGRQYATVGEVADLSARLHRLDAPASLNLLALREWDVALTAIYYDSFGWHTREDYETFAREYGFDILAWPGYPVMRAVREFLMVTWLVQQAGVGEGVASEASKRLAALRTGASRKDWKPY